MIDRLLLWAVRATNRLNGRLVEICNSRRENGRRRRTLQLVNQGRLCSQQTPGLWCDPWSHDPRCYYARFPKGMLPPRRADGAA